MKRKRVPIHTEVVGFDAAFEEGRRELADKGRLETFYGGKQVEVYLPCVGGPLDGELFRVPTFMLQTKAHSGGDEEIQVPAAQRSGLQDHLPRERRLYATYRLDRSSRLLRYVRTAPLGG